MYKFLIYISYSYSIPIGKPLQEEIERRGYKVYWFSELEDTKHYLSKNEKLLNTVEEVLAYNPDIILTKEQELQILELLAKDKFGL